MNELRDIFTKYKAVVFFDTETTGLEAESCQIIELAAIRVEKTERGTLRMADSADVFVKLPEGERIPQKIVELTGITDEQLETVCKACGLDKFVHSLPQGFDTVLSESTTISAGQKQLLTIARAMLQNAPMLILDEATSSVDARTELLIQRAMDELTKGRTSFVIAHRLSTIKNADLILVMRDGDVIESGTHEQLMEQNGFYAELYNSQFAQAS